MAADVPRHVETGRFGDRPIERQLAVGVVDLRLPAKVVEADEIGLLNHLGRNTMWRRYGESHLAHRTNTLRNLGRNDFHICHDASRADVSWNNPCGKSPRGHPAYTRRSPTHPGSETASTKTVFQRDGDLSPPKSAPRYRWPPAHIDGMEQTTCAVAAGRPLTMAATAACDHEQFPSGSILPSSEQSTGLEPSLQGGCDPLVIRPTARYIQAKRWKTWPTTVIAPPGTN